MLPPQLGRIKSRLEEKGYNGRTIEEDGLLEELDALDGFFEEVYRESWTVRKSAEPLELSRTPQAIGRPSGTCQCCGSPL